MKVKLQVFTFFWDAEASKHVKLGHIFGKKSFFPPLQFLIKMAHADFNKFSMNRKTFFRTCQREFLIKSSMRADSAFDDGNFAVDFFGWMWRLIAEIEKKLNKQPCLRIKTFKLQ